MMRRSGDRRGRPRFEIVGDLWGSAELHASLTVRNVGRGGALLASPVALLPGTVHEVLAVSDEGSQSVTIRVRHSAPVEEHGRRHYLVGVEFLDASPALEDFLARSVTSPVAGGSIGSTNR
jgi:hypothetical protein